MSEKFKSLSRVHQRHRQTDGFATTQGERNVRSNVRLKINKPPA